MDVLFSIVTGLVLRLLLDGLDDSLGRLGPVLLGLWEGAAMHHLSAGSSILDHYLAYTLRIAVDLYFTSNARRTLIVLLFTMLSLVISEYTIPTARPRAHRLHHRRRSSRTLPPAHIHHYVSESLPASSTPAFRPSRPPTPPSFFLEGESESNSPHILYPNSNFADGDEDSFVSPAPKQIILPNPSSTLTSEARDTWPIERLSTIEEHSSGEESSRRSFLGTVPGAFASRSNVPSYAPSAATPLPVPNSTIRYIHTSISQAATPAVEPSSPSSEGQPLPVPNSSTKYYVSEDDGGDPLQTPPAVGSARWELVLTDDTMNLKNQNQNSSPHIPPLSQAPPSNDPITTSKPAVTRAPAASAPKTQGKKQKQKQTRRA
ncbi:hypothetical protein H0H87_004794 [Tephrocybe sp. NHM501043]|nr:hypothetical protein H0H87_004794 [Tephrocybe sp. NHM501043]